MFKSSLLAFVAAVAGMLPSMADVPNPSYAELSANFVKPPKTARAGVYWYFMDGNLSREGATKDLEAMRQAGIGYVIFLEVGIGVPRGKVDFMSDEWLEFFKHIVSECERLDIRMVLGTGPGWCGSGGPWVQGADSMRQLMASSVTVEGGGKRTVKLPVPPPHRPYFGEGAFSPEVKRRWLDYYEDVAVLAFPEPAKDERIADSDEKAHYTRAPYSSRPGTKQFLPAPAAVAAPRPGIDRAKIVDLTGKLRPDGTLEWDVPAGRWTVMRFGARNNGAVTRPAPRPGLGFECDKFDSEALKKHFANFQDRIFQALGPRPQCFGGLKYLHIDSWEMGAQNWSDAFRAEFTRRRGYDPLSFYPVWEGRIVGDENLSERFLWDLRLTSQELIVENHVLAAKRYAHGHGLKLSTEPYDMNPTADLELGVAADIPMGEFWHRGFNTSYAPIEGVSAAHAIGQPVVPAESFTSHNDAWRGHPASIKNQNDWALAIGLNRLFFHTFQHQSLPDHLKPGMTMGPYGVHWDRNQTWWPMASGYHTYLSRCQYLLQQGRSVADILYLVPESMPHVFRPPVSALDGENTNLPDRKGYNFDGCPPSIFLKASVRDGKVVLPGGAEYSIVELPHYATATPQMLEKYCELAKAGATLVGVPPMHSPSLTDYPACDERVRAIARELWGDAKTLVRQVGKGRVFRPAEGDNDRLYESYGVTAARLAQMGVGPDFASDTGAVRYHHRTAPAGDLYFIASRSDKPQTAVCSFRMTGSKAEVWNALDGTRCAVKGESDGKVTRIKLDFAPHQSYFVVFCQQGNATAELPPSKFKTEMSLAGPWKLDFLPPVGPRLSTEFAQLADWKDHENPDIRHFSGIAVYEKHFDLQGVDFARRTWLSLGKVCNMARVTLNGRDLGIQWTDPWRVETTGVLRERDNVLRVEVANLWTNRLVGDAQLPDDGPRGGKWPEWVLKGTQRPTRRVAFQAWRHYNAKSPLEPSGLLGPVEILSGK